MNITISPRPLNGTLHIIPSKSQAHRFLIASALADAPTALNCAETNRDIEATASCLRSLGAKIERTDYGYRVTPITNIPLTATLDCGESGSTLRFLLPIVGALGVDATFMMHGRLPQRPLSPLWEEMERVGCTLTRPTSDTLRCQGKLRGGIYRIAGNVSSQYITGLLLALPLLPEKSTIKIIGTLESKPYVDLTMQVLRTFGIDVQDYHICGAQRYHTPKTITVEGDWSNGAFFLTANVLGSCVTVTGLNDDSVQGDRAICDALSAICRTKAILSVADIPDLVPILSIAASIHHGAVFTHIERLRIKESDRVSSVIAMLEALGGRAEADEHTLTVHPVPLIGGTVDACNDHRIAMSAAIAATVCKSPVTVLGAQCVEKSYPNFWKTYQTLGGSYEQYLR